ncbi:MAG: SpoIIE family protein phosphatase [Candidatus Eisenbacteria bacterium]|nr:SpoIIE family protein phosphatase [Candidatus Eisenbacteria bacterium]
MPDPAVTSREPSAERLMDELRFLSELCQVVAAKSDVQPILDWIVNKTIVLLSADEGSIKLLGPDVGQVAKTLVRRQSPGTESGSWPAPISISVMGFLMHHGGALASSDLLNDERFAGLRGFQSRIRSVLAVPLNVDGRITGMLAVTTLEPGRQWSPNETQLLSIVASNSAGVIEQARLRTEAQEMQRFEQENQRIELELNQARSSQMNLVPSGPLVADGWEVHGRVVPAQQVGGDAFDYFLLEGDRLAVAIADVAGKGVPAALLMSNMQASLRAFCNGRHSIPEALRHLNRSVTRSATAGKFITLFYAELDPAAGRLSFSNAGHNPPLLRRRDGSVEMLEVGGLPLGIFEESDFQIGNTPLHAGDALLLYSDGIPEAFDTRDEVFGDERLMELWRTEGQRPPDAFIELLLSEVARFRGSASQSDDMTVVVLGPRSGA